MIKYYIKQTCVWRYPYSATEYKYFGVEDKGKIKVHYNLDDLRMYVFKENALNRLLSLKKNNKFQGYYESKWEVCEYEC